MEVESLNIGRSVFNEIDATTVNNRSIFHPNFRFYMDFDGNVIFQD